MRKWSQIGFDSNWPQQKWSSSHTHTHTEVSLTTEESIRSRYWRDTKANILFLLWDLYRRHKRHGLRAAIGSDTPKQKRAGTTGQQQKNLRNARSPTNVFFSFHSFPYMLKIFIYLCVFGHWMRYSLAVSLSDVVMPSGVVKTTAGGRTHTPSLPCKWSKRFVLAGARWRYMTGIGKGQTFWRYLYPAMTASAPIPEMNQIRGESYQRLAATHSFVNRKKRRFLCD